MNNPKITVVTVCFNAAKTLEKTIQSVINQTYNNIEYIIIDGASTDGTLDIIKKYEDKISCWKSEPDKGIYDAMNKGLKFATGDFLIFMGADDLFFDNDIINRVTSKIYNCDEIYYGSVMFKGKGTIHWGEFNKIKWATGNICHQAIFYPKAIYSQYDYDTSYSVYADYIYNLNLLKHGIVFHYICEIITLYDTNGFSSYADDKKFNETSKHIKIEVLGHIPYLVGSIVGILFLFKQKISLYLNHNQ